MRRRLTTLLTLLFVAGCIAYIAYAFTVPPEWALDRLKKSAPVDPKRFAALPLDATFTTAGQVNFEDLTLSFKYPEFWNYGELQSNQVDATIRILRPGDNKVHAAISLLVTRSPTALHHPKPIVPPGATIIHERREPFGTTEMIFIEFATITNTGDYQHGLMLESTDAKRYVSLMASCHGPPGTNDVVDQQFEELKTTFEAVLYSLNFQPAEQ